MAGIDNLRTPSTEEAREMQLKSAKKRSQNIKERKLIKQGLEEKLGVCFDEYINSIFDKALSGDTKAWELIRDTLGEKPTEKIEQINTTTAYSNLTEEELRKLAGG